MKVKAFNFTLGDFEGEIEILQHTEHSLSILKTEAIHLK